ncbi:hypothetical protein EVAR_25714_1 [Eumeta japonica]|uniref:Uncharacterized protein n=1 Tax=Eumeta variegata TaxID=151549 RepID=A0A4C1YQF2_EUMVA|nr:hypothetical protein EVAR_25714_1 [Eumeta japonica]
MPRKELIEPATTAQTTNITMVLGSSPGLRLPPPHLTGSSVAPQSPCRLARRCRSISVYVRAYGTPAPLLAGVSEDQLAALLSTLPGHKRSPIVFLYNHYWHRRRTAMERPRRPRLAARVTVLQRHHRTLEVLQNARLVLMVVPVILTCSKHS